MMKFVFKVFILLVFALPFAFEATAQKAKPTPKSKTPITAKNEKAEFEKVSAIEDKESRIAALQGFLKKFPKTSLRNEVVEQTAFTRAKLAAEKFEVRPTAWYKARSTEEGIELLRLVITELPVPYSDNVYNTVIAKIPFNVFFAKERTVAYELAELIESNIGDSAPRLLNLADFYLLNEDSPKARIIAEKAVLLQPESAKVQEVAARAYRFSFRLEDAETAYGKAVELDPNSTSAKRGLADMKRALGKFDEAINIYRFLLTLDEKDEQARTGYILSLFGADKGEEAEKEMDDALEKNSNNVNLFAGAAYWHIARGEADKASDLAAEAIAVEPRFVWAHIVMARSFIAQKKPLEAEKSLLEAQLYGNFPTLIYELANARFHAGFYEEATQDLQQIFTFKDGKLNVKLGGKIPQSADNFISLLEAERRSSIFQFAAADSSENAERLKNLLIFNLELQSSAPNEAAIVNAAKQFIGGKDAAQTLRQLYVAKKLLDKKVALSEVIEMTKEATSGVNSALDLPSPSAGVMADELFAPRRLANSRGEVLGLQEVPRPVLDKILRGRIEELAGWSLFNQNKPAEAIVRLKRAVSVLPENSAWWRSSYWRLGTALDSNGQAKEAIEAYIKSYRAGEPDLEKHSTIEAIYRRVNGSLQGLEKRIGIAPKPSPETIAKIETPETTAPPVLPTETPEIQEPEIKTEATPKPETPVNTSNDIPKIETPPVSPTPTPEAVASETPEVKPEIIPQPENKPEVKTESKTEPKVETPVEPLPTPKAETPLEPLPIPKIEPPAEPSPTPKVEPTPETLPTPKVEPSPELPTLTNEPTIATLPTPKVEDVAKVETKTPEKVEETPIVETEKLPVKTEETPKIEEPKKPAVKIEETPKVEKPEKTAEKIEETTKIEETPKVEEPDKLPVKVEETPKTETIPESVLPAETSPKTEEDSTKTINAPDYLPDYVNVRPRVVKIETEKERKQREKDEREAANLREKENEKLAEERKKAAEEREKTRRKEAEEARKKAENNNATTGDRSVTLSPAEVKSAVREREATPKDLTFKTLPLPKNEILEEDSTLNPAPNVEKPKTLKVEETPKADTPKADEKPACSLRTLQKEVLISSNGGLASLSIDVENLANIEDLKATSSNKEDIQIDRDAEIGRTSNGLRVLFLIKSISDKSGVYTVTIDSPCGKLDVLVKVQKVED